MQKDRLVLVEHNIELLAWPLKELELLFTDYYRELSLEEATLKTENERAMLQIVVHYADLYDNELHAELHIFVQIKNQSPT